MANSYLNGAGDPLLGVNGTPADEDVPTYETSSTRAEWAAGGGPGGGGAVELIDEEVTSSSQATVTFSAIAATWRDLELRVRGRGTNASDDVTVHLRFNGDTGANYDYEHLNRGGTDTVLAQTLAEVFTLTAANSTSGYAAMGIIHIADYRGTTFHKAGRAIAGVRSGSVIFTEDGAFLWRSTAAITSIEVSLSAGNFVDGSVVSLYGVM